MRVERLLNSEASYEHTAKLRAHAEWLLKLGDGKLHTICDNVIEVPNDMVSESQTELENRVYDNFLANYNDPQYLLKRAIMSSTNDNIQEYNFNMVNSLPGEPMISTSIDCCVEENDVAMYDAEYLNRINVSGIPPHRLILKVGACIILIRNLNIRDGHCNGTRYIITELKPHLIVAKKLKGGANSEILVPRIPMISKESDFPVPFKRLQFPVLLAYYLTPNRAQGQSLDRAGAFLPKSVFSHGHLYVMFSRCGDPDYFAICVDQAEFKHISHLLDPDKTYTRNIVFREVFS
ncbi:hypothetical protein ACHAWF_003203 [Thalassiosira exigua]